MTDLKPAADFVVDVDPDVEKFMEIETTQLEPIIATQKHLRWQLPQTGLLSSQSFITIGVKVDAAANGRAFPPLQCGIASCIKRATLSCSGRQLCTNDSFPEWFAWQKSFNSTGYRSGIDLPMSGVNMNFCPSTAVAAGRGKLSLRDVPLSSPTGADCPYMTLFRDNHHYDEGPLLCLRLSDLFPVMRQDLPLFAMDKEQVTIDIELNQQNETVPDSAQGGQGEVCCYTSLAGTPYAGSAVVTYETTDCKLYMDLLQYSSLKMEDSLRAMDRKQGASIPFTDVVSMTSHVPYQAPPPPNNQITVQNVYQQAPVSNLAVKNMIWCDVVKDFTANSAAGPAVAPAGAFRYSHPYFGRYACLSGNKASSYNVRANDVLLHPEDVESETLKSAENESIYSTPQKLPCCIASFMPCVAKTGDFAMKTSLVAAHGEVTVYGGGEELSLDRCIGCMHYESINLGVGRGDALDDSLRIGPKPISLLRKLSRSRFTNYAFQTKIFCETVRHMGVSDGNIELLD